MLERGASEAPAGRRVPAHAAWVEAISEWILSYEQVRSSDDPRRAILDFLDSVYRVAVTNGGWDAEALRYAPPRPVPQRYAPPRPAPRP